MEKIVNLPEEIRQKIFTDAQLQLVEAVRTNSNKKSIRYLDGYEEGYTDGATVWATRYHEADLKYQIANNSNKLHVKKIDKLAEENARLRKALEVVSKWQLPATGQFWDDDKTNPMSYGACYGSNGERDFMRNVAVEALAQKGGDQP